MLPPKLMIKKNENEIRRLLFWFETNFKNEVIIPLLKEKFIRNVQNVLSLEKSMSLWEQVINLEKDDELTKFFNILQDDE